MELGATLRIKRELTVLSHINGNICTCCSFSSQKVCTHFGREESGLLLLDGKQDHRPWGQRMNLTYLRDSGVPRNIFRHEALTELINMTYSLKRVILNENWADNSTNCPKHRWKFCEVEIRNFKTQNVGITSVFLATEVQRVPLLWRQFTLSTLRWTRLYWTCTRTLDILSTSKDT